MSLTYTWKLKSLSKTDTSQFKDVVVQTEWEVTGTDAEGYSGIFHGTTPFPANDVNGDGFINYKDLTEEIVLGWIQQVVTGGYKQHIDELIMREIIGKKSPIIEVSSNELPWAQSV